MLAEPECRCSPVRALQTGNCSVDFMSRAAYHDLKLALHLLNLILCLDEVLAVQVAVCPHRLIQVLLLLQPRLTLHNLRQEPMTIMRADSAATCLDTSLCLMAQSEYRSHASSNAHAV